MNISVDRKELTNALKRLSFIVPSKTTMPILQHCLLEAKKNGKVILHATDLEHWVYVELCSTDTWQQEVTEKGSVLLPVKETQKVLKGLDYRGVAVNIHSTGDGDVEKVRVHMQSGKTKFTVETRPLDDFPTRPKVKFQSTVRIESDLLSSMIDKTVYAVSCDETRSALACVFCELTDNTLALTTTDGHRLTRVETSALYSNEIEKATSILIPAKAMMFLSKFIDKDISVDIEVGEKIVQFSNGPVQVYSRLDEGPYPKYKKVIPKKKDFYFNLTAQREDMLDTVKRLLVFSDKLSHALVLDVNKTKMTISATTGEGGRASEDITCVGSEPFAVGYDGQYLKEALQTLNKDEVTVSMGGNDQACLIKERTANLKHTIILMPIRV